MTYRIERFPISKINCLGRLKVKGNCFGEGVKKNVCGHIINRKYEIKEEASIYKRVLRPRSINETKIIRERKQCNFYKSMKYILEICSEGHKTLRKHPRMIYNERHNAQKKKNTSGRIETKNCLKIHEEYLKKDIPKRMLMLIKDKYSNANKHLEEIVVKKTFIEGGR